MDKKLKDKSILNFLKKEGFYVVLFVCLCVVAVVAAVTAKNAKTVKEKPQVVEVNKEKDVKKEEKENIPNAIEANKNTQTNVATSKPKETNPVTKPVVNTNVTFAKPVEGVVVREYTDGFVKTKVGPEITHQGIDIQAKEGTPVYAAAEGKVEKIDIDGLNGFYGKYVVIKHANGVETTYAALKDVTVKQGDVVNTKSKIGEVGNSAINFQMEDYGAHLWLQVVSNGKYENPLKVFSSYKVIEKK